MPVAVSQLGTQKIEELRYLLLQPFTARGVFSTNNPKLLVPSGSSMKGKVPFPLVGKRCVQVSEKQRTFSLEKVQTIRLEITKVDGTQRYSTFQSAMASSTTSDLCDRTYGGDWRKPNALPKSDGGGLGNMELIFHGLKWKNPCFTEINLASGSTRSR